MRKRALLAFRHGQHMSMHGASRDNHYTKCCKGPVVPDLDI